MKKTAMILAAAFTICLYSCGGGDAGLKSMIEDGTKKDCEKDKLEEKMRTGDSSVKPQIEKLSKELEDLEKKFDEKYKDKMNDTAFMEKASKYEKEAKAKYCK